MDGSGTFYVRLRILFSRVRLWQAGSQLDVVCDTPIWPSSRYFGTVDDGAIGLDQVVWTMERYVAPHPSHRHTYTFLSLMDDMARQTHSPEVRRIIMYLVDQADFQAIPHFRSFIGRVLR